MAFDLAPNCSFLFGYFSCNLLQDIIDVNITICTLKGIHTFRRDCTTQISKCSPWGLEVRPFPSLQKMRDYIEERQAIVNPFSSKSYPSGHNPSPFVQWPKATTTKERTVVANPRKVKVGYYPPAFQGNWVWQTFPTQPKAASQASSVQMQ